MRIIISALLIAISFVCSSQPIAFRDEGSTVTFTIRNFGLTVNGTLKGLLGHFILNQDSIGKSYFTATVRTESIYTGVSLRDKHLRGDTYFNSNKFPVIKLESSNITRVNGIWRAVAILTMKDVSKSIDLPFTLVEHGSTYLLKGTFSINRRDFNIGGNSLSLSDIVEVKLDVKGVSPNRIGFTNSSGGDFRAP